MMKGGHHDERGTMMKGGHHDEMGDHDDRGWDTVMKSGGTP